MKGNVVGFASSKNIEVLAKRDKSVDNYCFFFEQIAEMKSLALCLPGLATRTRSNTSWISCLWLRCAPLMTKTCNTMHLFAALRYLAGTTKSRTTSTNTGTRYYSCSLL